MPRAAQLNADITPLNPIREGIRNETLFRHLMRSAPHVASRAELVAIAHRFNLCRLLPPLPDEEVQKTAGSAWGYQERGLNWLGGQAGVVVVLLSEIDLLCSHPNGADAIALLSVLRREHSTRTKRGEAFAIACKAMARDRVFSGWRSRLRYEHARNVLEKLGFIACIRRGQRKGGRWLPALWIFERPRLNSGPGAGARN
jgi:hypothetical protein